MLALVNGAISQIEYPKRPGALYSPISFTLESGGKRVRPLLVLMTCEALGGKAEDALNQAVGLEMFHNFTLIHDDVMDRSLKRRNRPTVYHKWGEVQAILSGDTLLTMATQRVMQAPDDKLRSVLDVFNRTAIEIYEGQQFDTTYEARKNVSVKKYLNMIMLKTSVLLGAACELGAIMAGASDERRRAMYEYGVNLGLAFQLRDDWLDNFGDVVTFGKNIGNDILTRKKTWFYITALARKPEDMERAYAIKNNSRLIPTVKAIYSDLGLDRECNVLIDRYCSAAINSLEKAKLSKEDYTRFSTLALRLSQRQK